MHFPETLSTVFERNNPVKFLIKLRMVSPIAADLGAHDTRYVANSRRYTLCTANL